MSAQLESQLYWDEKMLCGVLRDILRFRQEMKSVDEREKQRCRFSGRDFVHIILVGHQCTSFALHPGTVAGPSAGGGGDIGYDRTGCKTPGKTVEREVCAVGPLTRNVVMVRRGRRAGDVIVEGSGTHEPQPPIVEQQPKKLTKQFGDR